MGTVTVVSVLCRFTVRAGLIDLQAIGAPEDRRQVPAIRRVGEVENDIRQPIDTVAQGPDGAVEDVEDLLACILASKSPHGHRATIG